MIYRTTWRGRNIYKILGDKPIYTSLLFFKELCVGMQDCLR